MWSSASTTALWTVLSVEVGTQTAIIIGGILLLAVGLLIIGMAYRTTKKHVTGKKF